MPDPRDPRPDCERHGCGPAMGWAAWTHTDDCKREYAAAQHQTWPARANAEAPEHRAARQRTEDERAALTEPAYGLRELS
ncbi:hypothetical protein [Dactylosporangium sp. CA-139066]|uniref:hypothetical protein n=1 Tax=Dactylosporangium sp. CA-139066 TaxID=3239930 RepID=UPI003D934801